MEPGRKSLGFRVSTDIDFVFVWVVDIDLISVWRIELDLISVWGSELLCSVSRGPKFLGFMYLDRN